MTDENPALEPEPAAIPETQDADSAPAVEVKPDDAGPSEVELVKQATQRRIDELTRNWRQEQREKQALLDALQQRETPKAPEPPKFPKLEDFGYDEPKYQAALLEHTTSLARAEVRKELDEERKRSTEQHRLSSFEKRQADFIKSKPDYAERVLDATLPITTAMRDVIVDSDSGPELAYWLAENRDKAAQIAQLPPHLAALELGRVEGRLQAVKEAKAKPIPQAPPPPPSVEAVESDIQRDPDEMSMGDWLKWRNKQVRRKG